MQVHYGLDNIPSFKHPVLTIGTFDGVHTGHAKIITRLLHLASSLSADSVIITFHPHPRHVLQDTKKEVLLLTTLEEKIELLRQLGVGHLVIIPFDETFSNLSAQYYIEDFLIKRFQPHTIIIGYDHRFGKNRSGGYALLEEYQEKGYFQLEEISVQTLSELAISSTRIREALMYGNPELACQYLGRPYSLSGTVVHGVKRGRLIGFPTANIECQYQGENIHKLIPKVGVYAIRAFTDNKRLNGMLNIGYNPTVTDEHVKRIEANLFDFEGDLYEKKISIEFVARLRDEEKFENLDALIHQLNKDKEDAMMVLG